MKDNNKNAKKATLSFKTSVDEKIELQQIANDHNVSRSELIASLVHANKYHYDQIGKPSPREAVLESELNDCKRQIRKLNLSLENAEQYIEIGQKEKEKNVKELFKKGKAIFDLQHKLKLCQKKMAEQDELLKSLQGPDPEDYSVQIAYGSLATLVFSGLSLLLAPRLFNK